MDVPGNVGQWPPFLANLFADWYTVVTSILFHTLSVCGTAGQSVSLKPSYVQVDVNSWVNFTCKSSCTLKRSHTIHWFVGNDPMLINRNVFLSRHLFIENYFESITGIHVRIENGADHCTEDSGFFLQTLQINATSIDLDRIPVQCVAVSKMRNGIHHLSYYAVLRVAGEFFQFFLLQLLPPKIMCSIVQKAVDLNLSR